MKILVDARALTQQRAGTGRYLCNLFNEMQSVDTDNDYTALVFNNFSETLPELLRKNVIKLPNQRLSRYILPFIDNIVFPKIYKSGKFDIFYLPGHFGPGFSFNLSMVITIHDLSPFLYPEMFPTPDRIYLQYTIKKLSRNARWISVPSKSTKDDLIRILNIKESKIKVIQPSINLLEYRENSLPQHLSGKDYILYVGAREPRKNLKRLIEAYSKFNNDYRKQFPLFITGPKGWKNKDIPALISRLGLENDIIMTGYVSDEVLAALFTNAALFCYPSIYEGFGFPPLEAMYYGAPVLTSNVSSIPEVTGDAAYLVDPYSVEEIFSGMKRLIDDASLRSELKEKSKIQARKFINNDFAKNMLELFNKAR